MVERQEELQASMGALHRRGALGTLSRNGTCLTEKLSGAFGRFLLTKDSESLVRRIARDEYFNQG